MTFTDLLNSFHIMPQFPPSAAREAAKMPPNVDESSLSGRLNLTEKQIITIDGDDAMDFDDAVSLETLESGNYLLGVHIADVSHYVKEGSAIDRSAFMRGTSIYLIDTVIPMLPFELSHGLCSLKPGELRLTVSVFMVITPRGRLESYRIENSYIRSNERMTYNNVSKILKGDKELCERYSKIVPMLQLMNRLAAVLKKKRLRRGSIEFVTHEALITLNKAGEPTDVHRYPIGVSNGIIEEFMLIANETVARHMNKNKIPCVYRVHEAPDPDKTAKLCTVLAGLGINLEFKAEMKPKDFQSVLKQAEDMECFSAVNYLTLRTMAKAKYSEKNLGHFGLAASDYCHFTSPIRRYSDLALHRMLKRSLKGELTKGELAHFKEFAIAASTTASTAEINATDAELKWKAAKKAEYMQNKIGEKYQGNITHITNSGFFVELENTVEGFVPARTLTDDIYTADENGISITGMKTKRSFSLGETVNIKVAAVDAEESKIDFEVTGLPLRCMARKGKRRQKGAELSKKQKQLLREIKQQNYELRREKSNTRKKADFEKSIFENSLTKVLANELLSLKKPSRSEKRFLSIMLSDFVAFACAPVYKNNLYGSNEFPLKNALLAAAAQSNSLFETISESFGISISAQHRKFLTEIVCAFLRHMNASMQSGEVGPKKRENEYEHLYKKHKNKLLKGEDTK